MKNQIPVFEAINKVTKGMSQAAVVQFLEDLKNSITFKQATIEEQMGKAKPPEPPPMEEPGIACYCAGKTVRQIDCACSASKADEEDW